MYTRKQQNVRIRDLGSDELDAREVAVSKGDLWSEEAPVNTKKRKGTKYSELRERNRVTRAGQKVTTYHEEEKET